MAKRETLKYSVFTTDICSSQNLPLKARIIKIRKRIVNCMDIDVAFSQKASFESVGI